MAVLLNEASHACGAAAEAWTKHMESSRMHSGSDSRNMRCVGWIAARVQAIAAAAVSLKYPPAPRTASSWLPFTTTAPRDPYPATMSSTAAGSLSSQAVVDHNLYAPGVTAIRDSYGSSPSYATAAAVASQLGIDDVRAGVLPDGKRDVIVELQRKGHLVAMAGDGVASTPAAGL